MSVRRGLQAIAASVLLAVAAAACGGASAEAACPAEDRTIPVPQRLGGLHVFASEKATEKFLGEAELSNSYVCDASVFELRIGPKKKDELISVLQVVRLTEDARVDDLTFLQTLGKSIVSNSNLPEKIGDLFVWTGLNNSQLVYVWFQEHFMQVLLVRQTTSTGADVAEVAGDVLTEALALRPTAA